MEQTIFYYYLENIFNKSKFNVQCSYRWGKSFSKYPCYYSYEDINKISTVLSNENGYYEFNGIEGDKMYSFLYQIQIIKD